MLPRASTPRPSAAARSSSSRSSSRSTARPRRTARGTSSWATSTPIPGRLTGDRREREDAREHVGSGKPFHFVTEVGSNVTPTYVQTVVPLLPAGVNIDHVVSDKLTGSCWTAGRTAGHPAVGARTTSITSRRSARSSSRPRADPSRPRREGDDASSSLTVHALRAERRGGRRTARSARRRPRRRIARITRLRPLCPSFRSARSLRRSRRYASRT